MYKIYLSPSNQQDNNGANGYNEEKGMHYLASLVKPRLESQGFTVFISDPSFTLEQVVNDSNDKGVDLHVCLHSDATGTNEPGGGTTSFSYSDNGDSRKLALLLYKYIAPLSPSNDHGIQSRPGLYELKHTKAPAALIENFFHTNAQEVEHFRANIDKYANAITLAVCEYFEVPYKENTPVPQPVPQPVPTTPNYKEEGAQWLYDHGYTKDKHNPLETLDVGTFGKILQHFCEKNKIGG